MTGLGQALRAAAVVFQFSPDFFSKHTSSLVHSDLVSLTEHRMTYTRITVDTHQMGGVPCIRGLRIPVATVVAMVADRMSEDEILEAYPDLETEDIRQALHFAAQAVQERELPLALAS